MHALLSLLGVPPLFLPKPVILGRRPTGADARTATALPSVLNPFMFRSEPIHVFGLLGRSNELRGCLARLGSTTHCRRGY